MASKANVDEHSLSSTSSVLAETRHIIYGESNVERDMAATQVMSSSVAEFMHSIDSRLKVIESHVQKIDEVRTEMKKILTRVNDIETKVRAVSDVTRDLENNMQGLSNIFDSVKTSCELNTTEIERIDVQCKNSKETVTTEMRCLQRENEVLKNDLTDLRCRSMKFNLVFAGLHEVKGEHTEALIQEFVREEMRLEDTLELANVHRFGRRGSNKPRPILVRFVYQQQHDLVLRNANRLKGKPFSINEQFPAAVEEVRKKLYPIMKEKRRLGHKVKLVRDKMYVNGVLYCGDEDNSGNKSDSIRSIPNVNRRNREANGSGYVRSGQSSKTGLSNPNKRSRVSSTPDKTHEHVLWPGDGEPENRVPPRLSTESEETFVKSVE